MSMTVVMLKAAIEEELALWMREHPCHAASDINCGAHPKGCCSDFASCVYERLGGVREAYNLGIRELGIEAFVVGNVFVPAEIAVDWPDVKLPEGVTWDDMNRLAEAADFGPGTHEWLEVDGLHFDCECPQGTRNPFDLPFFRRVIGAWQAEMTNSIKP